VLDDQEGAGARVGLYSSSNEFLLTDTGEDTGTPAGTKPSPSSSTSGLEDSGLQHTSDTGKHSSHSPTVPDAVTITVTDVVACEDPSQRFEGNSRFELQELGHVSVEAPFLSAGGVAVADLDRDGIPEIIRTTEEGAQVWEQGAGTFVGSGMVLDLPPYSYASVSAVDVDSDGDVDLFFGGFEAPNALMINDGMGRFAEEGALRGLGDRALRVQSGAWGDPDGDGDLDLFVPAYGPYPVNGDPADPAEFFLNDGEGYFTESSSLVPMDVHSAYGFAAAWLDVDGDRQAELFSIHDFPYVQPSQLLDWHEGSFRIDEMSNFHEDFDGMGVALADLNQDGHVDVVRTGFSQMSVLVSSPDPEAFVGLSFMEYGAAWGFNEGMGPRPFGWGVEVVDLNNNGDQEVIAVFGELLTAGEIKLGGVARPMRDALWVKQPGEMKWTDEWEDWGLDDERVGRGLVVTDLNQDGWLDVVTSILDGPTVVRYAKCGEERSLTVRLGQTGLNPDAIGAALRIDTDEGSQYRWISSGSRSMYGGETPEAHFGVGDLEVIERVEVTWPDGFVTTLEDVQSQKRLVLDRVN